MIESAPALANVGDLALGALDHQVHVDRPRRPAWTWSASASTTSGPIVIGGTKWPSITSTWMTSRAGVEHRRDLLAQAREVGGQDRRRDAVEPAIRSAGASSSGSGCTCTARCRTCARSSSARRSSGTPSAARSGAGSSRSGSGPGRLVGRSHGSWQAGQTSPRSTCSSLAHAAPAQPCDEEPVRAVAVRERLQERVARSDAARPGASDGRSSSREVGVARPGSRRSARSFSAGEIVQVE